MNTIFIIYSPPHWILLFCFDLLRFDLIKLTLSYPSSLEKFSNE